MIPIHIFKGINNFGKHNFLKDIFLQENENIIFYRFTYESNQVLLITSPYVRMYNYTYTEKDSIQPRYYALIAIQDLISTILHNIHVFIFFFIGVSSGYCIPSLEAKYVHTSGTLNWYPLSFHSIFQFWIPPPLTISPKQIFKRNDK
jgi:hypothetical protein